MNGKLIKKMLRPLWRTLPVSVRSRLLRLSSRKRPPRQSAGTVRTEADKFRAGLPTLPGLLENIRENGFSPFAILDIGANVGEWSRTASSVFASSRILMFDGGPDNDPGLPNTVLKLATLSKTLPA